MKKANLACAHLSVARVLGKFGVINLTRLQAKFDENLKFESKFCGTDGFLKFNPNLSNLLKFEKTNLLHARLKLFKIRLQALISVLDTLKLHFVFVQKLGAKRGVKVGVIGFN